MNKAVLSALGLGVLGVAILLWIFAEDGPTLDQLADDGQDTRVRLRVLTYNVLADEDRNARRWPAIFALLERSRADIVCLQEVEPRFLYELHRQPWFFARYRSPEWNGFHAYPNGNYICARFPIEDVAIVTHKNSRQRRRSLVVEISVRGERVAVATCHLESPLEDGAIRAPQLRQVFAALDDGTAILAGDLNFGDGEQPESDALDPRFTDAWRQLHPDEPGYTWNIEASPMAAKGSFPGERSRRLDRILFRGEGWRAESIELIGTAPIDADAGLFPSDHFGLLTVLQRSDR